MTISKDEVSALSALPIRELCSRIYGAQCRDGGEVCGVYRLPSGVKVLVATPSVEHAELRTFKPLEAVAQ